MPIARFQMPDGRIGRFEVPEGTTPEQAQSLIAAHMQSAPADAKAAAPKEEKSFLSNVAAGVASGFADVGDTILKGVKRVADGMASREDLQKLPGIVPIDNAGKPAERSAGLKSFNDERKDSTAFNVARVGGNIAATLPVGGVLGAGAKALGASAPIVNALTTGGMRAGTTPGPVNMLTRMVGGAGTGAASSALINPEDAATGAVVGAALPPVLALGGKVGGAVGRVVSGPEMSEGVRDAAAVARDAGYVLPPSQVKPTLFNRLAEGFAGKLTTGQQASIKNQAVTNKLAAQAVGLPTDTPITKASLEQVRRAAGQAYDAVASTGQITPTQAYSDALDNIVAPYVKAAQGFPNAKASPIIAEIESLRSPAFDAASAVAKIKTLRAEADAAYGAGNKDLGKALKLGANALEEAIDTHLTSIGAPANLLSAFREARQLIAKTHSVEKGLNVTTGSVNAQALAAQLKKGRPLSGELDQIAQTAQAFPSATKEVTTSMPGVSPLDFSVGAIGTASGNPLAFLMGPARMATRAGILSGPVQNRLAAGGNGGGNALAQLLANPGAQQMIYRAAPPLSSSR